MTKTILLTGATDGIGFEAAKLLVGKGDHILIHGRSADKLARTETMLRQIKGAGNISSYKADLSVYADVVNMSKAILSAHERLDVLINNAGVFKTATTRTETGLDIRFMVNTIAPYILTQRLLPILPPEGRIINLSSAAQAPVDISAIQGQSHLSDGEAYAQSKLAITMWSAHLAQNSGDNEPLIIAVNPASLLGTKMVKEAYGMAGKDIGIGADIIMRAAHSDEFEGRSGQYFDNDSGRFASPHPDALDPDKNTALVKAMEQIIDGLA